MAALIAFAYAFFLYRKDALLEEVSKQIKWLLASFRFLTVFAIILLLLGVIIENLTERKEQPLIFIANDNSASVVMSKDSAYYQGEFVQKLNTVSEQLAEKFEVINYDFSTDLEPGFSGDYSGKSTDLSVVFNRIFDQYTNRNIGGIVLASDGIYNTGANPLYAIARKSFLPIFTVGMGDTSLVKDVRLDEVNHNDIAFLGNEFPVEIALSETKCEGETVTISIYEGDKLIKQEKVTFTSDQDQARVNFVIKADRVGYRKYRAEISAVEGEYSEKNNSSNFYIEVIDGRQKILIAHQSPHPDIAALRYVIEGNKNYEVAVSSIAEAKDFKAYDLVIVHSYTAGNAELNNYIENGVGPVLFLIGGQTDIASLQRMNIGFSGRKTDMEAVGFSHNPNYKEILISPAGVQMLSAAPPLQAPFGSFEFSGAIEVMAYQKVGNIQLEQPLIYFTQKQNSRFGVIMGDGIWRWRLHDQMKNKSTANFNDFFGKLITYLAVKENKDPFKIQIANEYTENDEIVVRAELYNKSYDLINDPEVSFTYANENGEEFESYFVKTSNAYQLKLGKLQQGVYTWKAATIFQDEQLEKTGTFVVREIKIEYLNTVADHRLLRNIAENSGGDFFFPNELDQLANSISQRDDMVTVVYQEKEFDDLIDYKWLFVLIVLLLSVEWFIRKCQGAY